MQTRQLDPNQQITVTITRTAAQWQDFLGYLDFGQHRVVRAVIDTILQQMREPVQQQPEMDLPSPPPPRSRKAMGDNKEEANA